LTRATVKQLKEVRAVLARARELVLERRGWTKRAFARDKYGHPVPLAERRAVRFCAAGAILRADIDLTQTVSTAQDPERRVWTLPRRVYEALIVFALEGSDLLQELRTEADAPTDEESNAIALASLVYPSPSYWLQLAIAINDLRETRHRDVLSWFGGALTYLDELIEEAGRDAVERRAPKQPDA
jgi:hypothetical protein